jgi:hypothetical protein
MEERSKEGIAGAAHDQMHQTSSPETLHLDDAGHLPLKDTNKQKTQKI